MYVYVCLPSRRPRNSSQSSSTPEGIQNRANSRPYFGLQKKTVTFLGVREVCIYQKINLNTNILSLQVVCRVSKGLRAACMEKHIGT